MNERKLVSPNGEIIDVVNSFEIQVAKANNLWQMVYVTEKNLYVCLGDIDSSNQNIVPYSLQIENEKPSTETNYIEVPWEYSNQTTAEKIKSVLEEQLGVEIERVRQRLWY